MHSWLELAVEGLPGGPHGEVLLQSGLGEAAFDIRPGSRFLAELNSRERLKGANIIWASDERE